MFVLNGANGNSSKLLLSDGSSGFAISAIGSPMRSSTGCSATQWKEFMAVPSFGVCFGPDLQALDANGDGATDYVNLDTTFSEQTFFVSTGTVLSKSTVVALLSGGATIAGNLNGDARGEVIANALEGDPFHRIIDGTVTVRKYKEQYYVQNT